MKIRRGDEVVVLSGKDRGKKGAILYAFPAKDRVVVEGIQLVKRHQKPSGTARRGGIVTAPRPIPSAKVQLVCPSCNRPTRVGYRLEAGQKVRICKRCGEPIGQAKKTKPEVKRG